MRRAMTLIELIFSIIIIGAVFMTIPRIVFVTGKAYQLGIKEDAVFNAAAVIGHIARLPWDQHTIDTDGGILDSGGVECNSTSGPENDGYYRRGGFVGSRNCIGWSDTALWKPTDSNEGNYSDVDDYDGWSTNTSGGRVTYTVNVDVNRTGDIKHIKVSLSASGGKMGGNFKTSFFFDAVNLGWVRINRRAW